MLLFFNFFLIYQFQKDFVSVYTYVGNYAWLKLMQNRFTEFDKSQIYTGIDMIENKEFDN